MTLELAIKKLQNANIENMSDVIAAMQQAKLEIEQLGTIVKKLPLFADKVRACIGDMAYHPQERNPGYVVWSEEEYSFNDDESSAWAVEFATLINGKIHYCWREVELCYWDNTNIININDINTININDVN